MGPVDTGGCGALSWGLGRWWVWLGLWKKGELGARTPAAIAMDFVDRGSEEIMVRWKLT